MPLLTKPILKSLIYLIIIVCAADNEENGKLYLSNFIHIHIKNVNANNAMRILLCGTETTQAHSDANGEKNMVIIVENIISICILW